MPENEGFLIHFLKCAIPLLLLFPAEVPAKPVPLSSAFSDPELAPKKRKKVHAPLPKLPEEYRVFSRAREGFEKKNDAASLENIQREIRLVPMTSQNKSVDKEYEDLFFALEIKKGIAFEKKRQREKALLAFQRGLTGLSPFKWPFYWREEASKSLAHVCKWNKKTKDEACLALARKVADAFPKVAAETRDLKALGLPGINVHGLRKLAATRLAEAGCSPHEIAA
ncbi:MAG: hypothetical protein EBX52_09260, partial [Proteobacteria bacterium]|nr:hypothetical protein [Pseudomonadota bacterium]